MQMSSHANDRIESRNISEPEIQELLDLGSRWNCKTDPEIHYARYHNLFAVLHGRGDWLITAYRLGE
jgi:hypothetical protein